VYKPPFPHEKAVEIIIEGRGKHFDPDLIDAFVELKETFRNIALTFADFEEERQMLKSFVDAGKLGKKTGEGFYEWEKGKPQKEECTASPQRLGEIAERLLQPYFDECKAALKDGIVDDADVLDAGMIFGTGFAPFRGGPLHYLETVASHKAAVSAPATSDAKAEKPARSGKKTAADKPESGEAAKGDKSSKPKTAAKTDDAGESQADAEVEKDGEDAS
jgi:3-hydroxyacyl-CoA dehydrogenase